ncbi:unnamed protein product [Rotaria sp. Silwood2]|nr:unnamed protein product [Rotaria sp. Silwood2]
MKKKPFYVSISSLVNIRKRAEQRRDNSPQRLASTAIVFSCIELNFFDDNVQTNQHHRTQLSLHRLLNESHQYSSDINENFENDVTVDN